MMNDAKNPAIPIPMEAPVEGREGRIAVVMAVGDGVSAVVLVKEAVEELEREKVKVDNTRVLVGTVVNGPETDVVTTPVTESQ